MKSSICGCILLVTAACVLATPYEPGSGWEEFSFANPGPPYPTLNDEEPFTFTVRADQQPRLIVEDLGPYAGERFDIYNFGSPMGFRTSQPGDEGRAPYSSGSWDLAPGIYSLSFGLSQWFTWSPKPLRAHFQVEILPAPRQVTVTPATRRTCVGGAVHFDAFAQGAEPLSFQWYFNQTNLMTGETNSRLNLIDLSISNAGSYSVIASNQFGTAMSAPATLLVFDACVEMRLYAGLSITGIVGRTYTIEYANDLAPTNWISVATNTLTQPDWLFMDTNTPYESKRFFRVRLQP